MINKCDKCNSEKLFVEIQGTRKGLYCSKCGKWLKWINKDEFQVAKVKHYEIINKDKQYNFKFSERGYGQKYFEKRKILEKIENDLINSYNYDMGISEETLKNFKLIKLKLLEE